MAFQTKTIFSVLYKTAFDLLVYALIATVVIGLLPNHLFPNFPFDAVSYDVNKVDDSIANWNSILTDKSEFLLNDRIVGPESLAERGEYLYTGLADGRLVEINKNTLNVRDVTRFNTKDDCVDGVFWRPNECGRPLGLRFHDNYLYVLDAFQGLFRVNVTTNEKQLIEFNVESNLVGIFNDFVFDPKADVVYITVSSTKWQLDRIPYSIVEYERSGVVFAANLNTKKVVKLLGGLRFANGIEISNNNLLISETTTLRIHKVPLISVHKAVQNNRQLSDNDVSVLGGQLIGEPDNIRVDKNGDLWVGIFLARKDGKTLRDYVSNWPFVRKSMARVLYLLSVILDYINTNLWHSHLLETTAFDLYSGHVLYKLMPTNGALLRLNAETGATKQILGSITFNGVSEAHISTEGDLYYGSFRNRFLGRLKKGLY